MQRPITGGAWRHDDTGRLVPDLPAAPAPAAAEPATAEPVAAPVEPKPSRRGKRAADTVTDGDDA